MRKILTIIMLCIMSFVFVSCVSGDDQSDHQHSYVLGKCECGATDPDYVPHKHSFVDGVCSCGEEDPEYYPPHEHSFSDGKCTGCGLTDPSYKPDYGSATVFAPGDTVMLVGIDAGGTQFARDAAEVLDKMLSSLGGRAYLGSEFNMNAPLEVIIGYKDETRPATVMAYKILESMERESYFSMRYAVYADNGCIAIAYDLNEYTNAHIFDAIGEELLSSLFTDKGYIAYPKGKIAAGNVDLIKYQQELDDTEKGEEWKILAETVGADIAAACKTFYTIYDEKLPLWVANLYDPGIGGFYASSGGRDGVSFGPDLQCTVQLIRFIVQTGMIDNIGTDWQAFIPEFMQQQMIYFAKSIQHKNGFFYHPQWGKDAVDAVISRRGRDLGWGESLLEGFGSAPVYTTPNGVKGDGISADEYWNELVANGLALSDKPYIWGSNLTSGAQSIALTSSLRASIEQTVSDVLLSSSVILTASYDTNTYLDSHVNFINYLLVRLIPGMHSNPYNMGNEVGSAGSEIRQVSNKLGIYTYTPGDEANTAGASAEDYKHYDGKTVVEMLTDTLIEHINPETGLWGDLTAAAPLGTEFRYTNGFMKTIASLTGNGVPYPTEYVVKAANALVAGILGDEESTSNCCDIYNVWTCIGLLRSNLRLIDDAALREEVEASIDDILAENAAEAILNTFEKIKGYKKYDGGFAHNYYTGTGVHQNLPVGVAALNQSDVDGTCISTTGLRRAMFEALNYPSGIVPKMYYEADWMRMLELFISQSPVIKYSYEGESGIESFDFEDELPHSSYLSISDNGKLENNLTSVKLGDRGVGKITKFTKGAQFYMDWKPNHKSPAANATYFEFDMRFGELQAAAEPIELRFYDGNNSTKRIYTLYIYATGLKSGMSVYLAPKTDSKNKVEVAKVGEWFNVRLSYFSADGEQPAAFKVYVNGEDTPVIVDEKFESGTAIPASNIGFARFLTMANFSGEFYVDNLRFAREMIDYTYDKPTHNIGAVNTPDTPSAPSTGSSTVTKDGVVTFDGATSFPIKADNGAVIKNSSQSGWKGNIILAKEGDNTFVRAEDLYLGKSDTETVDEGQFVIHYEFPKNIGVGDTFVFEGKFRASALADGSYNPLNYSFDITLRNAGGTRAYRTYFGDGSVGLNAKNGKVTGVWNTGEWFTLRIEYTVVGENAESATWDVKLYINDTLVDTSNEKSDYTFCASKDISSVGILISAYNQGIFDIDDIKAYRK